MPPASAFARSLLSSPAGWGRRRRLTVHPLGGRRRRSLPIAFTRRRRRWRTFVRRGRLVGGRPGCLGRRVSGRRRRRHRRTPLGEPAQHRLAIVRRRVIARSRHGALRRLGGPRSRRFRRCGPGRKQYAHSSRYPGDSENPPHTSRCHRCSPSGEWTSCRSCLDHRTRLTVICTPGTRKGGARLCKQS